MFSKSRIAVLAPEKRAGAHEWEYTPPDEPVKLVEADKNGKVIAPVVPIVAVPDGKKTGEETNTCSWITRN